MANKKCTKCRKEFPFESYASNKNSKDGKCHTCKSCNTIRARENGYKWRYGITKEIYQEMYRSQGGKCLICQQWFELLSVDHDHSTNRVRGLLCGPCNYNLGRYKEQVWVFENFIKYLSNSNVETLIKD